MVMVVGGVGAAWDIDSSIDRRPSVRGCDARTDTRAHALSCTYAPEVGQHWPTGEDDAEVAARHGLLLGMLLLLLLLLLLMPLLSLGGACCDPTTTLVPSACLLLLVGRRLQW